MALKPEIQLNLTGELAPQRKGNEWTLSILNEPLAMPICCHGDESSQVKVIRHERWPITPDRDNRISESNVAALPQKVNGNINTCTRFLLYCLHRKMMK